MTAAQTDHVLANPDEIPSTEDFVFGWPRSPLVHYRDEKTLIETDGLVSANRSRHTDYGWISWSSFTLAVGIGSIVCARKFRPLSHSMATEDFASQNRL